MGFNIDSVLRGDMVIFYRSCSAWQEIERPDEHADGVATDCPKPITMPEVMTDTILLLRRLGCLNRAETWRFKPVLVS